MSTNSVFEVFFGFFGLELYAENTFYFLASAGTALVLCIFIRVLTGLVYYSNISALLLFAKPIEKKNEVKKTPSRLVNRCVAEYMACGETGAPLGGADAIVMKNILKMSFIGINFKSLERFCVWLEAGVLGIAAAAAITNGSAGWIALIGGVFVISKLVLLYFDAEMLREKLFYGICTYLNRELGKFYIPDDKAGLRIFKNELHSSLMEQASILQNAINNLNGELSLVIKESYEALQKGLDGEIKKYDNVGEKLRGPIEGMSTLFPKFESSADSLRESAKVLSESIGLMGEKLSAITDAFERNSAAGAKTMENTEVVFCELRDGLKAFNQAYSGLEAELVAVKSTQKLLDASLQSYELSLQQTAGQVGDAIGSIVEYRGREATLLLNESISAHIKQFQNDTVSLIEKMTALFERSYEQNKSEMQTLRRIEELVGSVR